MTIFNNTLVANVVTTVTFTGPGSVVVENLAPDNAANSTIYGTADGVTVPTIGGDNCFAIASGSAETVANQSLWHQGLEDLNNALVPMPDTVVVLISASGVAFSCEGN